MTQQTSLIDDVQVSNAVSKITSRSERQPDVAILERTYVDAGVLPQLQNRNNQILYGRRGTGKSHVFRVLGAQCEKTGEGTGCYIDMRLLGSAHLMADTNRPLGTRCVGVFRDLLADIQNRLMDLATDPDWDCPGNATEAVSVLGEALTRMTGAVAERQVSKERTSTTSDSLSGSVRIDLGQVGAQLGAGSTAQAGSRVAENYSEVFSETVVFSEVSRRLEEALRALGIRQLLVLIDEWAAVPEDIQPFVAEFLKRTLLPSQMVTVKIAALEYRSAFDIPLAHNNRIGFEIGGDIAANIDLDDYFVYARTPDPVVEVFEELLFRHLKAELPEDYLLSTFGINSAVNLRSRLFTERETFAELVRAAEGVVRDFLSIFAAAYFRVLRQKGRKIDLRSVEEAARDWYETDKAATLSEEQQQVLRKITDLVIGEKKSRSFLLERKHARNPMIQSLFDLRLIHLIRKGYSDKERPGVRYDIYSLDYGTYVDLKRTNAQPELDFQDTPGSEMNERLVPFDDNRSIRRIILGPEVLGAPAS